MLLRWTINVEWTASDHAVKKKNVGCDVEMTLTYAHTRLTFSHVFMILRLLLFLADPLEINCVFDVVRHAFPRMASFSQFDVLVKLVSFFLTVYQIVRFGDVPI